MRKLQLRFPHLEESDLIARLRVFLTISDVIAVLCGERPMKPEGNFALQFSATISGRLSNTFRGDFTTCTT